MERRAPRLLLPVLSILVLESACGESREERLKRELGYEAKEKQEAKTEIPDIPPHPDREKLRPLLEALYSQPKIPDVTESAEVSDNPYHYELEPGVMSIVKLPSGLSQEQKIRAIVMATAEADAWAYRPNIRRPYADQIHKIKRGFGDDQAQLIQKAYADLELLAFFNDPKADEAIAKLPADVKPIVEKMKAEYQKGKEDVWNRWMKIKMYARRVVSRDEPFRPLLRSLQKQMGLEEPPPRTWMESMDAPFEGWAKQIADNEKLFEMLTNLREPKDREAFMTDTHSVWAVEGSPLVPDKAKNVEIDPQLGFGVLREDLGGGYSDLTFVFSKKLKGDKLRYAFLRSIIYGSLLRDFQMFATAANDFAERDADGKIDPNTAMVPDKYDPLYAKCGSKAAIDTLLLHYGKDFPVLAGLRPSTKKAEKILDIAHECVIEGARPDIYIPDPNDDKDVTGPAPGTRLALYQMLARFEKLDVDMAAMASDEKTEEDQIIEDAEAVLKRIKAQQEAGKGIK